MVGDLSSNTILSYSVAERLTVGEAVLSASHRVSVIPPLSTIMNLHTCQFLTSE